MPAYMVVEVYVRDRKWVKDYLENVPAILRRYGGEYLAVSGTLKRLEGAARAPDQVAILTFPSIEVMEEFMNCADYQPYKEARKEGADTNIVIFETAPPRR
jgi:uncharacterized protein (DUF1330 family)